MLVETYWSHSFLPELIRRDGVVVDIGMNDGGFTRLLAPRCGRVIGFEPDPRAAQNDDMPPNVTIVRKAIAAQSGRYTLHVNPVLCSSFHYAESGSQAIEVAAVTLEEALASQPEGAIDLVKIDIEGEETNVLLSAPDGELNRIRQLTVEFHDFLDAAQIPAIERVIARMRRLGFVVVCFSFRNYGDMLFVNQRLTELTLGQKFWIILRYKYFRGAMRVLRRFGQ